MAFALDAIVNDVTYSLSDGNPFSLEAAQGLAMPTVRRLTERAPRQSGDTDLGYRLEPRTITLSLLFYASSYSVLDGYRDTLATIFMPIRSGVIYLRVTRDDGTVRQIECRPMGQLDVRLVKEDRAGKLHRAVVQLRAADPLWYDPQLNTLSAEAAWWLADGLIGTANVLTHVEYPTAAQAMAGGTVAAGSPWTVAFQTRWDGNYTPEAYAFDIETGRLAANVRTIGGARTFLAVGATEVTGLFDTNFSVYMAVGNGGTVIVYRNNTAIGTVTGAGGSIGLGGARYWRSGYLGALTWPTDIPRAAIYDIALSATQRDALYGTMGTVESAIDINAGTARIAYAGDFPDYPVIQLTGLLGGCKIANTTIGGTIDFTGATVDTGEVWTLDTATKTILDTQGSSRLDALAGTGFYNWYLAVAPTATGGTNNIVVTAGSVNVGANVTITHVSRYVSY